MSPKVYKAFARIIMEHYRGRQMPRKVLEIGASAWTLLTIGAFEKARRVALNVEFPNISPQLEKCELVVGSSWKTDFNNGEFDCVLSCSTFEHDKYFWMSLLEIRRIISVGGFMVVGVPVYMKLPTDRLSTTLTYERHGYSYNAGLPAACLVTT